jgi:outer membrane lipoprotein SlyB
LHRLGCARLTTLRLVKTTKRPLFALALAALGFGGGCTFPNSGTVYDRNRVGRTMNIEIGDVVAVNDVTISGQQSVIGVSGGGLVGYSAASGGSGVGGAVAAAGGAVVGAIAGGAVEEKVTRKTAQEITIKLKNGDTIVIVQQPTDFRFAVGDHVQVLSGAGGSSVRRL